VTDARRPAETPHDHARRLYRAGTVNLAELARLTGVPLPLLAGYEALWRREMARTGAIPKRRVR